MSTLAGDFWVCGDCRSINNAGARQCYNCRTPRDRAAVDPSSIDPSTHGRLRQIELPPFRSSRWAAMLASILILAVAMSQVVQFSLLNQLLDYLLSETVTEEQIIYFASVSIVSYGIAALALIAWALWLSRTVTSMPALGLGYPAANGLMAFVENFIPILNLWRVPAIVRDVARRLEPKSGGDETMTRGESLIFAAWIGIFGGYLVPRLLGFFTSDLESIVTITGIGTGLSAIGAIFLVVLIWWIEGRILKRRGEQLGAVGATADASSPAEGAAGAAPATEPPAMPVAPDVVQTRSAFAAVPRAPAPSVIAEPVAAPPPDAMPVAPPDEPGSAEPSAAAVESPAEPAPPPTEVEPAAVDRPPAPSPPPPQPATALPPQPATAPAPQPASTVARAGIPDPTPPAVQAGAPNLTIRVSSRGMMTAEMDGETEHVMLDDLGEYAEALSHVGGIATIVVPSDDGMPGLIAKRAQRILEDAGVMVTIA